ncbi:hypothetical protein ACFL4G_04615 [Thermodesulfobacteriota bacterium]
MRSESPAQSGLTIQFAVLILATIFLVQCGTKPGHDKTAYLVKTKLGLSHEQGKQVKEIINGIRALEEKERRQYAGDNEALLKAARARRALEIERIESILDDTKKVGFREFMAEKEVSDLALVLAERLKLSRATTVRINKILTKAPTASDETNKEIEFYLDDEQKAAFRKMILEEEAGSMATAESESAGKGR